MKKNKALTAAISVLSLTMVSMCAIGGTFAKYTTNGSATDTAKVAKWGITITANTYDAAWELESETQDTEIETTASGSAIVAPGSEGKLVGITVSGDPEVSGTISHDVTFDIDKAKWTVLGDNPDTGDVESSFFYCPISFTVGTTTVDGLTFIDNYEGLMDKLNALDGNAEFEKNTTVSNEYTLKWKWEFSPSAGKYDEFDTKLGNAQPTFGATIVTTATQVN